MIDPRTSTHCHPLGLIAPEASPVATAAAWPLMSATIATTNEMPINVVCFFVLTVAQRSSSPPREKPETVPLA